MDLATAQKLADKIVDRLRPHCTKIMVVGSIRRKKVFPRDVDIVLIPGNQGALAVALRDLGPKIKSGPKIHSCKVEGQQVDIYIADEKTWSTLVLIRTGCKEHNVYLCARAGSLRGKLHADGSGLEFPARVTGEIRRVYPANEAQIFDLLDLPYVEPEKRG